METIVVIQARMGSSRLPGKVLKQLGNSDTLSYVVERCKKIEGVDTVVVATSKLTQDDEIYNWCQRKNVACFRGSEQDVLKRFVNVAEIYKPSYIVRVTADCPFIDYEMASEMVALIRKEKVAIIDIDDELPRGLAVEVFTFELLQEMDKDGIEERHREHVTFYAYEFKHLFKRATYKVKKNRIFPKLRITLDTPEDYEMLNQVASYYESLSVSSVDIIEYLLNNPEIAQINAHIEQKPVL